MLYPKVSELPRRLIALDRDPFIDDGRRVITRPFRLGRPVS